MKKELKTHGKPVAKNFPQWDYDGDDDKVAHLLEDLLLDKFIPRFYIEEGKNKGRKRKVESENATSKKKTKESVDRNDGSNVKFNTDEGSISGNPIDLVDMEKVGLSKLLTDFGGKFVAMKENVKAMILSSENALEAKFEEKQDATIAELRARIEQLETVVEDLRKQSQYLSARKWILV